MPSVNRPQAQPAASSNEKVYAPIPAAKDYKGSNWHEVRSYEIHQGMDIPCPVGSACVAPVRGTIKTFSSTGFGTEGGMIQLEVADADNAANLPKGMILGWGHVNKMANGVSVGKTVDAGTVIAFSNFFKAPHVHFIVRPKYDGTWDGTGSDIDPAPIFQKLSKGQSVSAADVAAAGGGGSGGTSDNSSGGGSTVDDPGTLAKATAFATFLELPGILNSQESIALTGQRSLMNDKPLFPFVEQVCKASLRSFQSMPNGDFFAFFPDYFGTLNWRTAYWEVHDIEIINGTIQLSDDALATHVFVVGDVTTFGAPGIDLADKIQSGGIINVFNAFMTGFLNANFKPTAKEKKPKKSTDKPDKTDIDPAFPTLANKDDALAFLERYGARPYYEEAPMIRSPYYETFLAYQTFMLMWSKQFLTSFEFTYMPELFPGGIIAFPEHGIQCFVDEVVHECNYESGFVTRANLSAPAAYRNPTNKELSDPSRAYIHAGMIQPKVARSPSQKDNKPSSKTKGQTHPKPKSRTNPTPRGQ